ncbi:MAG TPA: hypothetical protein VMF06_21930 [Candidatus Limnocylindria bacterium]|jgi:hypothetical protein|nr:hypothetical protein [Candidatus Limnocylindria bacterium]
MTPLKAAAVCLLALNTLWAGDEFGVNQTSQLDQRRSAIASLADGSIAVTWENRSTGTSSIWWRHFSADGTPISDEKEVFEAEGSDQSDPVIAGLSDGGFVVAWSRQGGDSDGYAVAFQRFDAAGQPASETPRQANVTEAGPQFHPQVASLVNGGFVLVWVAQNTDQDQDVFYRRVAGDGTFVDPAEIAANSLGSNSVTEGEQGAPRVAGMADGGYVVAYEDRETDRVLGVRFDASGNAMAPANSPEGARQFVVGQSTDFSYSDPAVAGLSTGGFAIAMTVERPGVPESRRVKARAYGDSVGDEFVAGSHTGRWERPSMTALPGGDFLIAWQAVDEGEDSGLGSFSLWVQRFGPDGTARNPAMMLNQYNQSEQRWVTLAPVTGGGFGAAWQSFGEDGDGYGVYGRVFPGDPAIPGKLYITRSGGLGQIQFNISFIGMAGRTHELQSTSDFSEWNTVYTTTPVDGKFDYTENGADVAYRFFRVVTQ